MKREGMPTQRLEEKRVGEHAVGGRGRERERAPTRRRERALLPFLKVPWKSFFRRSIIVKKTMQRPAFAT